VKLPLAVALFFVAAGLCAACDENDAFRPEAGKFPPFEKAQSYRGELVFVDHVNRRGSIRVIGGSEVFFQHIPHPFAMLPYGVVRYHNAPADLRNIPLGTLLHVRGFLPPDPNLSSVPVVQKPSLEQPAENHLLLVEDEPSYCLREGKVWNLLEVEIQKGRAKVLATLESQAGALSNKHAGLPVGSENSALSGGGGKPAVQTMTLDAGTRIWRGRECVTLHDLIDEGLWPVEGKKNLGRQTVQIGLSWLPAGTWENRVENQFHISDLWLDDAAMKRSQSRQAGIHISLIRTRLMPAWVDAVEYGKFGRATVTATLFGGMDESLYADFKKGEQGVIVSAENTLKPWSSIVSSSHIGSAGRFLDVIRVDPAPPMGSSGIQIRFETDLIIEAIRPGRVVRVRPAHWPHVSAPREEYLIDSRSGLDDRFPGPAIFPKY
jgi:hypothetical protein